jgi:hypothetical protein
MVDALVEYYFGRENILSAKIEVNPKTKKLTGIAL